MSSIYAIEAAISGIIALNGTHYSQLLLDSLNEIRDIHQMGLTTLILQRGGVGGGGGGGGRSSGVTPSELIKTAAAAAMNGHQHSFTGVGDQSISRQENNNDFKS